jgi:hypothetical protein
MSVSVLALTTIARETARTNKVTTNAHAPSTHAVLIRTEKTAAQIFHAMRRSS